MVLSFWLLCAAGFSLHFLSRYGVHWRTVAKVWPWQFVALDPPAWASSLIATASLPYILPELGPLIGMPVSLTAFGAFCCGYMGSSLAAKLPSLLPKKLQE